MVSTRRAGEASRGAAPEYLITGGAGFIGSHLAEFLVSEGARVRVLDNFSSGRRENLAGLVKHADVLEGDVRDRSALLRAMRGVDMVLHHAAIVSVAESFNRPEDTHEVNLTGTLNVLLAARASGVRRVVLASSSAVYGDGPVPASEDQETRPQSPYAVTKVAGEAYASALAGALGLQTVCLRYFNVYGPRQDPSSEYSGVIARFAQALLGRKAPIVYGDGQQSRDFVFVGDVVRAVRLACDARLAAHQVVNIGTGVGHTVGEVYDLLAELVGAAQPPRFAPARPGEILHSRCNPSRAEALIGFRAQVSLREGLEQTLAWYRSQAAGSDA